MTEITTVWKPVTVFPQDGQTVIAFDKHEAGTAVCGNFIAHAQTLMVSYGGTGLYSVDWITFDVWTPIPIPTA